MKERVKRVCAMRVRYTIFGLFASFAVIFFAGCPEVLSPPETPTPKTGPNVLVVQIAGEAAARTALPTVPVSAKYTISVTRSGTELGGATGLTGSGPFYIQLSADPVADDQVLVEAYDGAVKYAEGTYHLTSANFGSTPTPVSVVLSLLTTAGTTGRVDLKISFVDAFAGITAAEVSIYRGFENYPDGVFSSFTRYRKADYGEGTDFPSPGGIISLQGNYSPGTYVAQIDFFRFNGIRVSRLAQTFVVRGNLPTNRWDTGEQTLYWDKFASSDAEPDDIKISTTSIKVNGSLPDASSQYKPVDSFPSSTVPLAITPKAGQNIAVWLNGTELGSGSSHNLNTTEQTNSIVIVVTAPDGVTKKTYTVSYTYYYIYGTWYVSGNAIDDSGDGKKETPFKTAAKALEAIKTSYGSTWPGFQDKPLAARICIKGTIEPVAIGDTGSDVYDSLPPVLLEGWDTDTGTIDANNSGRPLAINKAVVILGNGLTLTGGNGTEGGGVYVNGGGTFIMSGGTISGNLNISQGGGVYVDTSGSFTMNGGSISENSVTIHGGGVCLGPGSSFTMNGGTVGGSLTNKNMAPVGGGVYVGDSCTFTMTGGTISGNTASSSGGGVYVSYFNGCFTMNGGTISGNTATQDGGGVYVPGDGGTMSTKGKFTMNGGTISGNTVSGKAGGVFVTAGGEFEMTGGSISGNTANGGGGVYVTGSGSKFTLGGGGTVSGNYSAGGGGGVYVDSNGLLTMTGGSISGNTVEDGKHGGGVLLTGGNGTKFNMSGGSITGNPAGTTTANGTYGGGVFVGGGSGIGTGAVFTMTGGIISGNKSGWDGGGVYVGGGGSFIMDGGSISGNIGSHGGGVDVHEGNARFTMNNGIISGNTANNGGGGVVMFAGGNFTMNEGTISRNNSKGNGNTGGGGVYFHNASSTFTMTGGTISENTSTGNEGDGGGVFAKNGVFIMSGGTISGNSITGTNADGGGVYLDSSGTTFAMSGGTISGNSATGANSRGGGVYINNGSFTISNDADIKENTARIDGGGVYFTGGGDFTIDGGTISGNTASNGNGDGVCFDTGNGFNMKIYTLISQDNDVWLADGKTIKIVNTPGIGMLGFMARITPQTYTAGTPVLSGDTSYCTYFTVTQQANGTEWEINDEGKLKEKSGE